MGSFANTLFSALLGWFQGAVAWLWRLIASADAGAWMTWVLDNWLALLILLCLAGLAVDGVVYLLRWQPYRVWRSFLGRFSADEEDAEEGQDEPEIRHWAYAEGAPEPRKHVRPEHSPGEEHLDAPIRSVKRVIPARQRRAERADGFDTGRWEDAYNAPYYPPQWHTGENKELQSESDGGTKA